MDEDKQKDTSEKVKEDDTMPVPAEIKDEKPEEPGEAYSEEQSEVETKKEEKVSVKETEELTNEAISDKSEPSEEKEEDSFEELSKSSSDSDSIETEEVSETSSEEVSTAHSDEVRFRGFNPNEQKQESAYELEAIPKRNMKKLIIWLSVLAVIALIVGWFVTANLFKSEPSEVKVEQTTPVSTPTPEPVVEQQLNREEWSLEVLNGSGTSGLAKKIASQLEELGYKVVKVGNAPKSDYETSQILVSEASKEKIDLVIADIKDVIQIATVSGELKDSTASARIIIGKE